MKAKLSIGIILALLSIGAFVWFQDAAIVAREQNQTQTNVLDDKVAITLGDTTVFADIADSPEERARGLSGRRSLSEIEGMLFVFENDDRHSFWMHDMLISIDMIWLSSDKRVVYIVPNATPESYPTSFAPDDNARYVLEVPANWAARHKVIIGSQAIF